MRTRLRTPAPPADGLLGQYRILERLGAGGMGQVYKAEHLLMKRVVALKVLDPGAGPRTAREVEAAARLVHPNIVTAYDAAEADGLFFLVMEYVEGTDLEQHVAGAGPLPVPLACEVVRQAATALQYLHNRGLVHRDVKPANLILTRPDGGPGPLVKLLDLGLARRTSAEGGEEEDERLDGTPDFLAPEVGHDPDGADPRSDLYSLGCTFYYLLAGRVPYPGGSWPEKLLRHRLDTPVPIHELCPDAPAEVVAVVERLMARDVEDRYPTAGAVAEALAGCRQEPPPVPAPARPAHFLLRPSAPAVLLAVLLGLLAAWGLRRARRAPDPAPGPSTVGRIFNPSDPTGRIENPSYGKESPGPSFVVEGRAGAFAGLAEAVTAARDGDTITIDATGRVPLPPLSWQGKALTLRAAAGRSLCLAPARKPDHPWQALLATDRDLTLQGLELCREGSAGGPLVCCEGGALRMTDCRLRGGGNSPLVLFRRGSTLRLRRCHFDAGAVAVSAEVGQLRCRVRLADSRLVVRDRSGAALSVWAREVSRPGPADLELLHSTWDAGRVLALAAPVRVRADGNRFTFREALVSYDDGRRKPVSWQGRENHYDGPGRLPPAFVGQDSDPVVRP